MVRSQSVTGWDEDRDLNAALRTLTEHEFQLLVDLSPESRQLATRWVRRSGTGTWNQVRVMFSPAGFELAILEEIPCHSQHTHYQHSGNWADPNVPTRTNVAEQAIALVRLIAGEANK